MTSNLLPAEPARLAPAASPIEAVLDRVGMPFFLVAYLVALTGAEVAVVMASPMLVFPLHGGLSAVLLGIYALLQANPERSEAHRDLPGLMLALTLAPLIRIISLTLPLGAIVPAFRYLAAGVPMVVGALLVARTLRLSRQEIGLQWRSTFWQVGIALFSISFGFIEFIILRPEPLGSFALTLAGIIPALSVGLSTGFSEELLFRGVLQRTLRPVIGRWTVLYASVVFAVLHVGYRSIIDLAFVFAVGIVFGYAFERSRSIIGVTIGHAVANITLYFVAPFILAMVTAAPLP